MSVRPLSAHIGQEGPALRNSRLGVQGCLGAAFMGGAGLGLPVGVLGVVGVRAVGCLFYTAGSRLHASNGNPLPDLAESQSERRGANKKPAVLICVPAPCGEKQRSCRLKESTPMHAVVNVLKDRQCWFTLFTLEGVLDVRPEASALGIPAFSFLQRCSLTGTVRPRNIASSVGSVP